ncbi:Ankyrin repeat domain containing protein [Pandoravirus neocaledonia]|uniref:Ankyrin repeat domain containing protein n=1 Tax=Pandoravirus neocaledonia TaxID=2107708 RepID=A0A2U7UDZ4_9VIRU|nr:Ankyrin repeat domain containing protein [Pandoravirus neocaledonia]AVK76656.1 Ankyrin repeat domain containing protein [Pandoravirus neocaledonia]
MGSKKAHHQRAGSRRRGRPRKRRHATASPLCTNTQGYGDPAVLPVEIRHRICALLDDRSFCAARVAHRCFCVCTAEEITRTRKMPRWLTADRVALCGSGNIVAVKALVEANARFDSRHLLAATVNGHCNVVIHICENKAGLCVPTTITDAAARYGHIDIVHYLAAHRTEGCTSAAIKKAASRGFFDIVRFLYDQYACCRNTSALDHAAATGHLDIVRFLYDHGEKARPVAMDFAARRGHFGVVRFLHDIGAPCTTDAMDGAALRGHIDVVHFLYAHRTEDCTGAALASPHREVVAFLRQHYRVHTAYGASVPRMVRLDTRPLAGRRRPRRDKKKNR